MSNRICPECGADLDVKHESARAHALSHWPEQIVDDPKHEEAKRRQAILYKMELEDRQLAAKEGK